MRWLALLLLLAGCDRPDTYPAPQDCVWVSAITERADIETIARQNTGGCGAEAAGRL